MGLHGNNIIIDRLSGSKGVEHKLISLGISPSPQQLQEIVNIIKVELSQQTHITDKKLIEIASCIASPN